MFSKANVYYVEDMRTSSRLTWGKLVSLLGILLASLQIFHMFLLSRLELQSLEVMKANSVQILEQTVRKLCPTIQESINVSPVMDSSGQYKIVYDVFKSKTEEEDIYIKYGVTLATHCSIDHVHHLAHLSHRWKGPISLAIFIPNQSAVSFVEALVLLEHCVPHIRHNVSIHLVFPMTAASFEPVIFTPVISSRLSKCENLKESLQSIIKSSSVHNYELDHQKYPNNLLRNVARRVVRSAYVMITDIDMLPNEHLYQTFIEFSRRSSFTSDLELLQNRNTVYVVPSFEVQSDAEVPHDKKALLRLWSRGVLRPFYQELCSRCQRQTNYTMWQSLSHSKGLSVAYKTTWRDPWEPFYIGHTQTLPYYDERFKQYGFNRISQVCEMHVAGFQFAVLDNAFLVHLGLKTSDGFHHSKDQEQEQNRIIFRLFKEELKLKYKDSQQRCY